MTIFVLLFTPSAAVMSQSVWNRAHLEEVKASLDKPFYAAAFKALIERADGMLDCKPLSVMMKDKTPASGNKHDYMSQARYTWPDPTKPGGLPYINRDGLTNPEINKLDRNRLGETAWRITNLSLAWYFSNAERYARKATELIRIWFLDDATRMNPNLEYAQMVPGHNGGKGRGYGLIDTYSFVEMLDGVALLEQSKSFTTKDSKQLKQWFGRLTGWMLTSEQGKEESAAENNHSVAYDAQVTAFSLYSGNRKTARKIIEEMPEKRIFRQIEPDGSQPLELKRTLAFHYSQYNMAHFVDMMLMAEKLGIDLGSKVSADGRGIYKAFDFLIPFCGDSLQGWPYRQIHSREEARQSFLKELYRSTLAQNEDARNRKQHYNYTYMKNRRLDYPDIFNLVYFRANDIDNAYAFAAGQLKLAMQCADKSRKEEQNAAKRRVEPRTINKDGSLSMVPSKDWCSGFFPGSLWQVYEFTNDDYWRQQAITWTWPIEEAKWYKGTHDLGFMMNNSFGNAYRLTGERSYKDVVLQSARTLIKRFNPKTGCIRSWDFNTARWQSPVIIDNMMNLEMLFKATQLTGDSVFWRVALSHAEKTMENHFRDDFSSFHVVDYDPTTGKVRMRCTAQGYSDDSFWSRGQAWALYGFTMCYRFTHNAAYLRQSKDIAEFLLALPNMPEDGIPYWDMKAPEVKDLKTHAAVAGVPRDASAAAIMASALYELAGYTNSATAVRYRAAADRITHSLNSRYQAAPGSNYGFLLLHSTGHMPNGIEIDVPLNYADYYYLEALKRKARTEMGVSVLDE